MSADKNTGAVLILEDEELVSGIAAQMLEHLGYEAVVAADGETAIEQYRLRLESDCPFLAVISDLGIVGGMGGEEAAREILKLDQSARIVASSGNSQDPVMVNYRQYGFSAAVAKPFNLADLSRILQGLA